MKIRHARPADVPAMLAVYRPFVEETTVTFEYETPSNTAFLARLEEIAARGPWLVLEDGGTVAGYAYLDRAFVRAAYAWAADLSIYLGPGVRRLGAGRALYTLLERMGQAQGYQVFYGLVTSENEASRRFHEAMGYDAAMLLPNCGFKKGRWHGVYWYEKRFGPLDDPGPMPTPASKMDWSEIDRSGLEKFEIDI